MRLSILHTKFFRNFLAILGFFAILGCEKQTYVRTARITGNSMEPNFPGERQHFWCKACDLESYFSPPPSELQPACPRCGMPPILEQSEPGTAVVIQPVSPGTPLRVGDVMAFDPSTLKIDSIDLLQVKRIAALPGQSLVIREGDLWINGERIQKTVDELKDRSIPIDACIATSVTTEQVPKSWLYYIPSSLYPRIGSINKRRPSQLLDESYWDWQESRSFVEVSDFGVTIQPQVDHRWNDKAIVEMRLRRRSCSISVTVHFDDEHAVFNWDAKSNPSRREWRCPYDANGPIHVALVDGCLRFSSGSEEVAIPLESLEWNPLLPVEVSQTEMDFVGKSDEPPDVPQMLFALRVTSALPTPFRLELYRDIHYRGPRGESEYDLAPTAGYQVLGDHVAASLDSRQAYPDGIPREAILGLVKKLEPSHPKTE